MIRIRSCCYTPYVVAKPSGEACVRDRAIELAVYLKRVMDNKPYLTFWH